LIRFIIAASNISVGAVEESGLSVKKFRTIKSEIRVLGVDDGTFTPHKGYAPVVGVIFRGGYWLDGVLSTRVKVDGFDATTKIASMLVESPHHRQVRVTMLDGITFGGFNVVNIKELNALTKLPVIVVTRDKPDFEEIHAALKNLPKSSRRWAAVQDAGQVFEVQTRSSGKKVYMEICGLPESDARRIVQMTSTRSSVPEALRVAHLVASGVSRA
jgi:endonuclease V-like protein UPF0215 family